MAADDGTDPDSLPLDPRAIVESALDAIVVIDGSSVVREFNPAAVAMLGWTRAQVIGRDLGLIIPPEMRDAHRRGLEAHVLTGQATVLNRRLELEALRADGARIPVELTVSRMGPPEAPLFTAFIRDISVRRAQLLRLVQQRERLQLLSQSQRDLAGLAATAGELRSRIAQIAMQAMGADGAAFEIPDGDCLVYEASAGMAQVSARLRIPIEGSLSGLALRSRSTLVCSDADADPRVDAAACRAVGLKSMIVSVLESDGKPIGVIKVMSRRPQQFSDEDVAAMDVMVGSLAGALERLERQQARELQRRAVADRVAASERHYRMLFTQNPHPMWVYNPDSLRFEEANAAATALYGYSREEFIGMSVLDLFPPEEHAPIRRLVERVRVGSGPTRRYLTRHRRKDGSFVDVELSGDDFRLDGRPSRLVLAHDVTERLQAERERAQAQAERERALAALEQAATHDSLTGLARYQVVQPWVDARLGAGQPMALLLVELDRFAAINQSLSHDVADSVLAQVGARIGELEREDFRICHLAGDEFIALVPDTDHEVVMRHADALRAAVGRPVEAADVRVNLTATVGIAVAPDHGSSANELLRRAEAAAEQGKSTGRDCVSWYSCEAMQALDDRITLGEQLRAAIDRGELRLVYQPLFRGRASRPVGFEALLRWQHPELGAVSPARFIPVAENLGLMGEIGAWVIGEACRQIRAWRDAGLRACRVAVNVSSLQLQRPGLVAIVSDALREHQIPASLLELEITESALIENLERVRGKLLKFADMGVSVALDDFGTGYSSLAYLKSLKLDKLKIDRGFVVDLPGNAKDEVMARTIVSIAHLFGMQVAAEGVETVEQADFLESIGCDLLQGYLLARPMEAEKASELLVEPPSAGA